MERKKRHLSQKKLQSAPRLRESAHCSCTFRKVPFLTLSPQAGFLCCERDLRGARPRSRDALCDLGADWALETWLLFAAWWNCYSSGDPKVN